MSKAYPAHCARLFVLCVGMTLSLRSHADCFPTSSGLLGWWPGDGNANNLLGTNNGTLQGGATASAPGFIGNAFTFDGTNGYVQIPNSPSLQPTNLTIEAWVRFTSLDSSAGTSGSPAGDQYIVFKQNTRSSNFEGFDLSKTRVAGSDYFRFLVTSASGQTALIRSSSIISTGVWYHVAAMRGSNFTQLYVNGVLERQTNVAFAQSYGTQPLYFGTSGQPSWDHKLKGNLDEVSLYTRALSSNEIASIYTAGSLGKCKGPKVTIQPQSQTATLGGTVAYSVVATGLGSLSYQWRLNGHNIPSATNSSLALTNIQFNQVGNYSVLATDAVGSALSSNAALSLCRVIAWGNNSYGQTNLPAGLTNVVAISAGNQHGVALTESGRVVAWGNSSFGITSVPSNLTNVTAVEAGAFHTIALQNGTVTAWGGYNFHGELNVPVGLSNIVAINAGYYHNLALRADGTVLAWGDNFWGQSDVPAGLSNVVSIAGGSFYSLALKRDGTVVAWGWNNAGQTSVPPGLRSIVAIAAGETFCLALRSDGSVIGWGDNSVGQLSVPSGLSNVVAIAAGDFFSMALKPDGSVVTWADSNVPQNATNITSIAAGGGFGLALVNFAPLSIIRQPASQGVYSGQTALISVAASGVSPLSYQWQFNGTNIAGAINSRLVLTNVQLPNAGNYTVVISNAATTLTSGAAELFTIHSPPIVFGQPLTQQAVLGTDANWNVSADGSFPIAYQWQFNGLNIPDATHATLILSNVQTTSAGLYSVTLSNEFGVAASSNAQLYVTPIAAWGDNSFGQTDVPLGLSNIVAVAGGSSHSLALKTDGTVVAWGLAAYGATAVPSNLSNVIAIAGAMALKSDGTVVSWGSGLAAPAGISNVVAIAAGDYHSLALKNDGRVLAWGSNTYGQTNIPAGLSNIVAISAGAWNSLLLKNDGTVIVVGANINGIAEVPVGVSNIVAIAQGGVHNLSLRQDGTAVPWGDNTYGENVLPAGVSNNIVSVATGFGHNLALQNNGIPVVWGNQNATPAWLRNVFAIAAGGSHNLALVNDGSPVIVQQPIKASAHQLSASGKNLFISVPVTGAQPLSYRWVFNGLPLSDGGGVTGSQTAILSFANAQTNNSGFYQLVASNSFGMVTSSVAGLTVLDPPVIAQPPQSQIVLAGSNAVFNTQTSGSEPLSYTWYFNGTQVPNNPRFAGRTTPILSISNIQTSDAGNYTLVLTNPVGTITSVVATLTVWVPAKVTLHPVGRSVPPGLPTSFSATGSGTTPLSYQWQLNGTNLPGATNGTLTIPAVGASDLGTYRFVVSNIAAVATSSDALLTFGPVAAWGLNSSGQCLPPPGLSNVVSVAGGDTYSLATKSDGTVVSWGAGGNLPVGISNAVTAVAVPGGALVLLSSGAVVNSSASLAPPVEATSNVVAIAAGNVHGLALRAEGNVIAWSPLTVTPAQANVPAGLNHVIAIAAGVNQSVALRSDSTVIAWGVGSVASVPAGLSNVVAIAAGTTSTLALKADGTVVVWGSPAPTNLVATFTNVAAIFAGGRANSSGQYLVVRSNGTLVVWGDNSFGQTNVAAGLSNLITVSAASGSSHDLALVNDGSPLILRPPIGGAAYSGRDVLLSAFVIGTPPLSYQWLSNGVPVSGATNSSLTLSNVQFTSAGLYQLVVTNGFGLTASAPTLVNVLDSVPFFLTTPVTRSAYLGSKFSLGAAAGGSGPLQFQWRFNGQPIAGATTDELFFNPARIADSGAYSIVASNSFGSTTSAVANLTVLQVVAWGDGEQGTTNLPTDLTNIVALASGWYHSLGLRSDGTVVAWGSNSNGQTNVPAGLSNVVAVAAGNRHSLALKADGTIVGWGYSCAVNSNALAALSNVVSIAAGFDTNAVLCNDGTVAFVGCNLFQVYFPGNAILSNIVGVAAGQASGNASAMTAIRFNGSVYGGLASLSGVLAMSYESSGLALRTNGTVTSWGIGNPPASVTNVVGVAAGGNFQLALRGDGSLVSWGATNISIPAGITTATMVSAGAGSAFALLGIRPTPAIPLPFALNLPASIFSDSGSPQWFGQTTISHDSVAAARSAAIGDNLCSSMRLMVRGPVIVRFWWKVSSETSHDFLTFNLGSSNVAAISGEVDWQQQTFTVPAAENQLLIWTYAKDATGSAGQDTAWLDQLELIPIPPSIVTQPVNQSVLRGTNVGFSVSAGGTPPLSYQWRKNGINLLGSPAGGPNPFAASAFTLSNVVRTNSGAYTAIIANLGGSVTSSVAFLSVHVPQRLLQPSWQTDGTFSLVSGDSDGGPLFSNDLPNFHAQTSTNLIDWQPFPTTITLSNGVLRIQDTNTSAFPAKYYRIFEDW